MTSKELKKLIKKALKEHESFFAGGGADAYNTDTEEGYLAYLLSLSLDYIGKGDR